MTELYGIDISTAQGEIDWDKLALEIDFVIIRATQGTAQDSRFERNIAECQRLGIPFGLYFAASAITNSGVEEEAKVALEYAKKYQPRYGLWYDMELAKHKILGKATITKHLTTWLEAVSDEGYRCGIYTNKDWLDNRIDHALLDQYDLWYAAYPSSTQKKLTDAPENNRSKLSYPMAVIWQWSSTGKIDGINGNVDLNVCYEEFEEIPPEADYITLQEAKAIILELGYKGIIL